ncbi:MAG TPA: ribbon-helix-helix protein, CopG family [Thermoanaerobaculia bacterium]|nr:ribbon-helix-helix protein, CopG family [Thermoanaerobaculia bacterium]
MRTTLTLDDDVARQLGELVRRRGASFKEVVNDTLRAGLQKGRKPAPELPPFRVVPKACGFRPGVDVMRLNQLYDEIESERLAVASAAADRQR